MGLKGRSFGETSGMKETHWKVIYTASRQEKKVETLLQRLQVVSYLPTVKKLREWSDRKKWVEVPLFNSYLFVKPEPAQRDAILGIPGVVKYLRYNGEDARVSDAELDRIRQLIQKGYDLSEWQDGEELESGDPVEVIAGPMKNYKGRIYRLGGESYAIMVLEQVGQSVKIRIPKQVLKKIGK